MNKKKKILNVLGHLNNVSHKLPNKHKLIFLSISLPLN
jgi:hypothetical protein